MGFFNFKRQSPAPTNNVESLRHRARLRLIGALILILFIVSFFSLILETSPRPPASDLPFSSMQKLNPGPIPDPDPAVVHTQTPNSTTPTLTLQQKPANDIAPTPTPATLNHASIEAPASGNWVVQLGAFRNPKFVTKALKKAQAAQINVFTENLTTSQGRLVQVRVGPFASKIQAEKALKPLKAAGFKNPSVRKR